MNPGALVLTLWLGAAPAPAAAPAAAPAGAPAPAAAPAAAPASPGLSALMQADGKIAGNPGDWVEYASVEGGKPNLENTFRLVSVDRGDQGRWVELWLDKTGHFASQFQPAGEVGRSTQVYIKMGAAVYQVADAESGEPAKGGCATGNCSDSEQGKPRQNYGGKLFPVKVVGGTFNALKMSREGGEFWYSEEIPVLRLARVVYGDGRGYELVATGKGARPAFPRSFKARTFPAKKIEAVFKGLTGTAAVAHKPAGCDPSVTTCTPEAPAKPPELPPLQDYKPKPKP